MEQQDTTEKPPSKKRLSYGPVAAILVTILAYFGSQLFGGILVGVYAGLLGYGAEQTQQLLEQSAVWQFAFILSVEILALWVLYWFVKRRKITKAEIGLARKPVSSDIGYALVAFGVYFVLILIVLGLVGNFVPEINLEQEQQIGFESARGAGDLVLVFISLVVLPPIVEEIMVRGFLYGGLRKKLSKYGSAIIASLFFAVAHLQLGSGAPPLWVAAIDTFILSLVLIGLRERTNALWSGMLVHGIKNGLAFLSLFVFHLS